MNDRSYRILIVDDDPRIRSLHAQLVEHLGYETESAADGLEALAKLPLDIDLVLLDGQMPNMDGFEVARRIRALPEYAFLPIVMVTGLDRNALHRKALEIGVNDLLTKPIHLDELELRSRWLLDLKRAHDRLNERSSSLEEVVRTRTNALRRALEATTEAQRRTHAAHLETISRLTVAAEYKGTDTGGHIERIGHYSALLAEELDMSPGEVENVRSAAPMHDVGKLGIPDEILLKPGRLDEDEAKVMRTHASLGADLLAGSESPVIQMGARIALTHHERWDGTGYPQGLRGEAIPLEARICAVVDFFDALTMDRPYRGAVPVDEVVEMMKTEAGKHFDPRVLDAFLEALPRIKEIRAGAR